MSVISRELQVEPHPTGAPSPFNLADLNILKNFLTRTGFRDIRSEIMTVTFEFSSAYDYALFCQEVSAPARAMLADETESRRNEIWRSVAEEAAKRYNTSSGSVRMDNKTICIVCRK
jgi:hypothetical protein